MSDYQLELEANKYHIGGYSGGNGVVRERIIDQLLKKDQANDSRIAIGISLVSLVLAIFSWQISYNNLKIINEQTLLMRNDKLPLFIIVEGQIKNEEGIYSDNQIRIYNNGKSIRNLEIKKFVFIRANGLDQKLNPERIQLDGYYIVSEHVVDSQNLLMTIKGVPNNNLLFQKLSNEFFTAYNSYLYLDIYLKINYENMLGELSVEYYKLNGYGATKISNEEGKKIEEEHSSIPEISLDNTNIEKIFEFTKK
jgi:hypothetical protein